MTGKGPVLFPLSFNHDEFKGFHPLAAGFFAITEQEEVYTYGKSFSLKLASSPEDSVLIEGAFAIVPESLERIKGGGNG